ncbi:MAG: heat-inducible transcription repressor HrcA [Actinobacteria bacterium]|nr:heat-inducible transcription repressor HrcA [Actinomycetota bacterium]
MAERRGELGERKAAVLRAVVTEFVRTGEPVGSETIAENYRLGVSPATIRNEMSALEEMGYLSHPHTSAGRIPTDVGYRSYVDSLPSGGRLKDAQRRAIADFFQRTVLDLEEVLRGTTQLLSRLTQYAGLAVTPSSSEERIVRVELIDIGPALLLLVVDQHGGVHRRLMDRLEGLDEDALWGLSSRLSASFAGMTGGRARARSQELGRMAADEERHVLGTLAEVFGEMEEGMGTEHVLVGGVANLAGEVATWRRETVRRLVEALEREREIVGLLRDVSGKHELSVTIGEEHPATGLWEASVVAAPYRIGDTTLGSIGVVGPTRMDYVSVIAAVRSVARRVSELVTQLEGDGDPEQGEAD